MQNNLRAEIDPLGYLIAPLVPPTLNILFVPLTALLIGKPENMLLSAVWMGIAWFGLEAICLATLSPLLWAFRNRIIAISISTGAAAALSIVFSGAASFLLFHTPRVIYAGWWSWIAAAISAVFAFSVVQTRSHSNATSVTPQP